MTYQTRRGLASDDLFGVRWLDEPRLTPDGRRMAYSMTGLDRERDAMLSWVRVGGGESAREHEGGSPCWSPDGEMLAFVSGDQRCLRLWAGGDDQPRDLLTQPDPITHPRWSPEGGRLAFVSVGRVWVADLAGGGARALTDEGIQVDLPVWLDADTLACVSIAPDGASARIWRVKIGPSPAMDCVLAFGGPIRALATAPDGWTLAFIGHDRGAAQGVNFGLWLLPLGAGEAARHLTANFDRSVGLAVRSDDARGMAPPDLAWVDQRGISRIYFIFCEGGSSHIAWAGLDGRVRVVVDGERACLSFSASAEALAFVVSHPYQPGEVHLADLDGKRERRVTEVNAAWVRQFDFRAHRPVPVLTDDGRTIEAWLLEPAEASADKKYPLILQIHGGPHYAIGNRFYFEFQRLAALGYGVLFSNPRGSQGYGEEHATCIRGAWGGRDYLDLLQTLDTALRDPRVDAGRLAITGVSYGAYMTHVILGRTARFRCAVTENGISNLVSNFAGSAGKVFWTWQMEGTPDTQPERYRALSPITNVDAIHTPLLLIHAEQDATCPIGQSEELLAALRARGREAALVRISGEGHLMNLIGAPSHRLQRAAALDAWLERWL